MHANTQAARDMIGARAAQIALIQDAKGLGTGILVSQDGWLLTNKHVAPSIGPFRVILADGRDVHGVGVHQCPHHDLAIVKISPLVESYLDLGADVAEDLHIGDEVYALGHPRGCRFSVARGILSNPHREFDKEYFVQADININPGNSGGPLVDREGKLVGIVTMTFSHSQGLGFAVPGYVAADYVRHVRRLVRYGVVKVPEALLAACDEERAPAEAIVRDAVSALVEAGKAAIEEDTPEEGRVKLKNKGALVEVCCKDGLFSVSAQVTAVGAVERANAVLLARLLELNGTRDLGGASFSLKGDGLYVGLTRPTAGLDVVEALWAVDLVLHLTLEWPTRLASLFFAQGTATPHAAAPIPAPAENPAPVADPGYPVVTLPPNDLYRR